MLRFLVPLLFILSSVTSFQDRPFYTRASHKTAASESQVKFAIENKYDDTGPGAKRPEYAYNTYKTLEDALVAYLDDPDTKLPEQEKSKAVHKLLASFTRPVTTGATSNLKSSNYHNSFLKTQFQSQVQDPFKFPVKNVFYQHDTKPALPFPAIEGTHNAHSNLKGHADKNYEPFKFQKFHTIKGSPLSLAHYTRDPDLKGALDQFDPHPKYSFSYGVHDKATGDVKHASETRHGGVVHGFYSYIDPTGSQRTVRYQADDVQGFRATVKKLGPGLAK